MRSSQCRFQTGDSGSRSRTLLRRDFEVRAAELGTEEAEQRRCEEFNYRRRFPIKGVSGITGVKPPGFLVSSEGSRRGRTAAQ